MASNDSNLTVYDGWAKQASQKSGFKVHVDGTASLGSVLSAARFRLDNGLTILLQPDGRAPIFAYQTWFRVGSKNEHPERTGLAHLFEHLMFKGTAKHPTGELDREMERRGTQTNAATWVDWTFYTESLAARGDNLQTVVEFESDRLTNLILDEQTFKSELEVVKNERRMTVDDSIAGAMSERLYQTAFTEHPYRWPVIGTMAHLERASMADLRDFYRTYYAPNNAVVVLAGSLDGPETLALLASHYGPASRMPVPTAALPPEPVQTTERRQVLKLPTLTPQIALGYHVPGEMHDDFPVLSVLAETLFSGDNGRLYRRLVTEEELVTDIDGGAVNFAEPGLFEVNATVRQGASAERVIDIIEEELVRLADGLHPNEFDKARNGLELSFLDGMRDAEDCAEQLGHYEINYGDFSLAYREGERCQKVHDKDARRVSAEIFAPQNRTVVIGEPQG